MMDTLFWKHVKKKQLLFNRSMPDGLAEHPLVSLIADRNLLPVMLTIVPRSMKKVWIIFIQKLGGHWIPIQGEEELRLTVCIILFFQEIIWPVWFHCTELNEPIYELTSCSVEKQLLKTGCVNQQFKKKNVHV